MQRGHLIDICFWAAYPIILLVGGHLQDRLNKSKYPPSYWQNTSLLPFGAVLMGRQDVKEAWSEINPITLRYIFGVGIIMLAIRGRYRRNFWLPHRSYAAS